MLSVCGDEGKEPAAGEQMCLTVTVRDTGIGIRPEDFDKLFEKFERMDLKKNSTVEGTGLGLAIVKHIAEQMNAKLQLDSEPGKGTVITVSFPQNKNSHP
jgi:signal transduction histidine kinase